MKTIDSRETTITEDTSDWRVRRARWVPECVAVLHDVLVKEGRGSHVTDFDGRRYLDLTGGLGVLMLGYAHPEVQTAITEQVRALVHTSFPTFPSLPYVECAERLSQVVGGAGGDYKTFFVCSGTEATENAVKIARFPGKGTFVTDDKSRIKGVWGLGSLQDIVTTAIKSQMELMSSGVVDAPRWVAEKFGVAPGTEIHSVFLIRKSDDEPFMSTDAFHPPEISSILQTIDLTKSFARTNLIIDVVQENCGVSVHEIRQTMGIEICDAKTSRILGVEKGMPLLEVVRENYAEDGRMLQLARSLYRTDRYRYVINLSRVAAERLGGWT